MHPRGEIRRTNRGNDEKRRICKAPLQAFGAQIPVAACRRAEAQSLFYTFATGMNISGNTVLVTGGSRGIGFELAAQFHKLGNIVVVTGRKGASLEKAKAHLPGLHTFQSDVSDPAAISELYAAVLEEFPAMNVLINNAGILRKISVLAKKQAAVDFTQEVNTNLMGPIRMVEQFLPHLRTKESAAIINVTSGLAFVPLPIAPVYCATKAGLHSFTQSLRVQLKHTNVKVFELLPPAIQTELLDCFEEGDMEGAVIMGVEKLVRQTIAGLKCDQFEIRPGQSNMIRILSRVAPQFVLRRFSKSVTKLRVD